MRKQAITRRDFMRTTASTASALAARSFMLEPGALAAPAVQANSATPIGRPAAPSDTIRFGMIGIGMQGSGLLATSIQLPGVECAAACDLYDGRQELAKEIVNAPAEKPLATTRHYKELLDNKDIDCIVAAVPDHWHKQIIVDTCAAGKDVYCEKPMTHHVPEGFEIIAAEHKNNRIVQIGSQRRSSIVYAKAKELIAAGAIGDVCLIEGTMGRNDPCGAWVYPPPPDLSPRNLDWETWLGTAPKRAFDPIRYARWRAYQDYGEGIPGDLYVHLLTGVHFIMDISAPPARAFAAGGQFRWKEHGRDVPDCLTTLYEYPNFRLTIRVTLNTDADEITRFCGTGGYLEIHDNAVTVFAQDGMDHEPCYYTAGYPRKLKQEYDAQWEAAHKVEPGTATIIPSQSFYTPPGYSADREHLWNFFQSVRTRRPSVEDGTFGNHAAIACHMANFSYFQKSVAVWDEAAKRIKADARAT
ncbi:MAG TPA: Gfo/Idh/MocA family oxidoreductase [Terriglobia bacterium]|nr:Gfo/Idh/MocA family oxidoreductase [Terriglobia bacterium]